MTGLDLSCARLCPLEGATGWLARLPGAVIWAPGPSPAAERLVATCTAVKPPGELLGRLGRAVVGPTARQQPPFVVVAARAEDIVLVVHGPVDVTVRRDGREEVLRGGDEAGSWVSRTFQQVDALSSVTTGPGPVPLAGDEECALADLRLGVIKAGGFVLVAAAEPVLGAGEDRVAGEDKLRQEDQVGEEAVAAAPVALAPHPPEPVPMPEPVPVVVPQAPPPTVEDATVMEHTPVADLDDIGSVTIIEAPAAALGTLKWDDGEVIHLGGRVLVGRDAASDKVVRQGLAVAVTPRGINDSMSRAHAELARSGAEVTVTDRGSTNGTFIWDPKGGEWHRLVPGEPQVVPPGTVIAFGERTVTFEA